MRLGCDKDWKESHRNTYRPRVNPHLIYEDKLAEFPKGYSGRASFDIASSFSRNLVIPKRYGNGGGARGSKRFPPPL